MNWHNVNLESSYERSQDILDGYDFNTLILEASCNLKEINEATVRAQAMESIKIKYQTAIEILDANLANITAYIIKEKKEN